MTERVHDGRYAGAVAAQRRLGGLTLAETGYPGGLFVAPHAHESALVTFVLDGGLTELRGSRRATCDRGSLIFQPADEPHGHRFSDHGARCLVLQFGSPWMDRLRDLGLAEPRTPFDLRRGRANWLAAQLHREVRETDSASALAVEGFALALLGELARTREGAGAGARPPWLVRAVDMLHASLTAELSMADLARAVGVHPVHLSRTFHRHYGMTMGEYVRRQRVALAQQELASTRRPLAEIALATGFSDQAHFSRVFKQIVGLTPGAYRKAAGSR